MSKVMERRSISLVNRYDANLLNQMTESEIDATVKLCSRNPVLSRLIDNWYQKKKPFIREISGPMSLTEHWSEKYKKHIYVFGEIHGATGGCVSKNSTSIVNYLKRLFNTTDAFIDFFLEAHAYDRWEMKPKMNKSYLDQLRTSFTKCMQPTTRHAKDCELVRVHYGDIRYKNNEPQTAIVWIAHAGMYSDDDVRDMLKRPEVLDSLRKMAQGGVKTKNYLFTDTVISNPSIKKAFGRIANASINGRIVNYLWESFNEEYDYISSGSSISLSKCAVRVLDKGTNDSYRIEWLKYLSDIFVNRLVGYAMDAYVLARMFKKFTNPGNAPSECYNVIIYGGEAHAQRYREFFDILGFDEIALTGSRRVLPGETKAGRNSLINQSAIGDQRCLLMETFPQPLFN